MFLSLKSKDEYANAALRLRSAPLRDWMLFHQNALDNVLRIYHQPELIGVDGGMLDKLVGEMDLAAQ